MAKARTIAAVLCVLLLAAAGCAPMLLPEEPWEKDARAILDRSEALFAKKQYDQASRSLEPFFAKYPKSRQTDRALYLAGELRLVVRDYSRALSYYKEIIEKFPSSPLIIEARYKLGVCYFEIGEHDHAIANLEDRSRISDPVKLRRISEILAAAYAARKNYLPAIRELLTLSETAPTEPQRAGYRSRVREIIEKDLSEDELVSLAKSKAYPADIAHLRLIGLMIELRKYREAAAAGKEFLGRFPGHPERTRAEMFLSEATLKLSAPRYSIAALVPRSGQLAFFGDRVLKGIQLAVHAYNLMDPDNRVELVIHDTEGSPDKAVAALKEAASKGAVAAIGPLLTKEAEAIASVLQQVQVPVITPTAPGPLIGQLSPWLFRNALTNSSQAAAAVQYAVEKKLKQFVILFPDDPYGKDLARLFTRGIARKAEVLASVAYDPETKDFGPYIRRVIEIDLRAQKVPIPEDDQERKLLFGAYKPGFDAFYLPGDADRVGLLIPQLAFYNMNGLAMIGSSNWHTPELLERADRYAEGAVFPDGFSPENPDPAVRSMVEAYRSAYQEEPDILSAQAYDAVQMVLSLLRQGKNTPKGIQEGLLTLTGFPGISGLTTFRGSGEAEKQIFFITVESGRFVLGTK